MGANCEVLWEGDYLICTLPIGNLLVGSVEESSFIFPSFCLPCLFLFSLLSSLLLDFLRLGFRFAFSLFGSWNTTFCEIFLSQGTTRAQDQCATIPSQLNARGILQLIFLLTFGITTDRLWKQKRIYKQK